MSEAYVYQVNRWDCPECGEVHETDAEFERHEKCESCGVKVDVK